MSCTAIAAVEAARRLPPARTANSESPRATGRRPGTSDTRRRPGIAPGTPSKTWGSQAGPSRHTIHGGVRSQPDKHDAGKGGYYRVREGRPIRSEDDTTSGGSRRNCALTDTCAIRLGPLRSPMLYPTELQAHQGLTIHQRVAGGLLRRSLRRNFGGRGQGRVEAGDRGAGVPGRWGPAAQGQSTPIAHQQSTAL